MHKLWKAAKTDRSQMFTILSALRNGTNGTYTENDDVTSDETLTNANYITVSSTQISAGATFTLVGTTTVTAAQTFTGGGKFVFAANSIVLMSATMTVSTTGGFLATSTTFTMQTGASMVFTQVTGGALIVFTSSIITMVDGTTIVIQSVAVFTRTRVTGRGRCSCNKRGSRITHGTTRPSGNIWGITIIVITSTVRRRVATSFTSGSEIQWCGDDGSASAVTVGSGDGISIDTQAACGASQAGTLTIESGGYLVFREVTASSVTSTATSFTLSTSATVEVITTSAAAFDVTLLSYTATTCFSKWTSNIDSCQSGYTCSIYSSGPTSGQCMLKFKSELQTDNSNCSLYGLLGLLAIPIALCGVFIISRMAKTKPVSYPVVSTEPAYPSVPKYPTMEYPLVNTPVY